MGSGHSSEQRGVSHLVGAVLLIGMTLTAAVLIVVAGSGTIGDLNEDNNAKVAGQTFQQMDETFQELARQDRSRERTIGLPKSIRGDVEVRESSWRLRLNGNPQCSSGNRDMGAMVYAGEERTVGYEGGGVWKMTESGATMESPPKMSYDQGSLSVQFPNMSGNVTRSNRISVASNVSRQQLQNNKLSKALYTDLDYDETGSSTITCPPNELDDATLWINGSQYASAWARYFETNYDERLVSVTTSQPIDSGDDVEVTFELGDVSDSQYNITDFDVSRSSDSSPLVVDAEITNEGGLDGKQDVNFGYDGGPTGSDTQTDVELDSGQSKTVAFEIPNGDINPSTTYTVTVSTENDEKKVDIGFGSTAGTPDVALDPDVPQNASVGADVEANVTVDNSGAMTAYEGVEFQYKRPSDTDWTSVGNATVTVGPGSDENATFDLPTGSRGVYDWRAKNDTDSVTGTYVVGSEPYFAIQSTSSDAEVAAHSAYELDATIRNVGDQNGTMPVEVVIERNTSAGWSVVDTNATTVTVGGTVYSSNRTSLDPAYRNSFATQGEYRYTVETPNETTTETFTVGPPENPTLDIESIDMTQNPTMNSNAWFNVTVTNIGPETANQRVRVLTAGGDPLTTEFVSVDPGESRTVKQQVQITDSQFHVGHNPVSVTTANASVAKTLNVQNTSGRGEDGVVVNEKVEANIRVLGAELEGSYSDDGTNYVIHAMTDVWLEVERNGETSREDLWQDQYGGNVNHPGAEKAMLENSSAYTVTRTFGEGSEISLFARSYECGERKETGVVFEGIMPGNEDAEGLACTNGGERITISDDANSQNVVILTDGDEVPSFGAADYYQRDLEEMLGHRIEDDGTLSLGQDEFVFLYELSKENADPANGGSEDDPDYNDAVGLFRVVGINRSGQAPANFDIEDVEAPASVAPGGDAQLTVTVNNTGGTPDSTSVFFDMEGQDMIQGDTGTLESGETETVTLDVPTDVDNGSYNYTVLLGSNPEETYYGSITIDDPEGPNFQITSLTAPNVNETYEEPAATVTVTNTGNEADTQNVRLLNESYDLGDAVDSRSISLDPGETTTLALDLPRDGTAGYENYKVKTDDAITPERRVYYDRSSVTIEKLGIGTSTYDSGNSLIERRHADKMSFKLENDGGIGGTRDVSLVVKNDSGRVFDGGETVQIADGRIYSAYPKWLTYDVGLDEGYYDYKLAVKDQRGNVEDTWRGELFISQDVDANSSQNSSSPVSVDSNEVVISG